MPPQAGNIWKVCLSWIPNSLRSTKLKVTQFSLGTISYIKGTHRPVIIHCYGVSHSSSFFFFVKIHLSTQKTKWQRQERQRKESFICQCTPQMAMTAAWLGRIPLRVSHADSRGPGTWVFILNSKCFSEKLSRNSNKVTMVVRETQYILNLK